MKEETPKKIGHSFSSATISIVKMRAGNFLAAPTFIIKEDGSSQLVSSTYFLY